MNRRSGLLVAGGVAVVLAAVVVIAVAQGLLQRDQPATQPATPQRVREPAVAGLFYPKDQTILGRMVDDLLAKAKPEPVRDIRAVIAPHAGFEYSGLTAAFAYKPLAGQDIRTVILLAPSHTCLFSGAFVSEADAYRTPLGLVAVSPKTRDLAKLKPFQARPPYDVRRPPWSRQVSWEPPPAGGDTPETWEHSGEVHLPFLQKVAKDFKLIPIVFGQADPQEAAKALAPLLDEKTLVVASTDLSHYHPYDAAREKDNRCVSAVCKLDIEQTAKEEACGQGPVLTVMHLARLKGWKPRLLDYRTSGDTAGGKSEVVGYAAISFSGAGAEEKGELSPAERKMLLDLARRTLAEVVATGRVPQDVNPATQPARFSEKKGCFVTLTRSGQLRGCIGHIFPQEPLYQAVMDNTRNAAIHDPRFPPVRRDELDKVRIEISVLTVPAPLNFSSPEDLLKRLQPHTDGVVLKMGPYVSTYLPQVWEQIPDKEQFLNSLSEKAGCPPDRWRRPGTVVQIYHVESFHEPESP